MTRAEAVLTLYRAKLAVDGLNGRPWDAATHLDAVEALAAAGEAAPVISCYDDTLALREAVREARAVLAAPSPSRDQGTSDALSERLFRWSYQAREAGDDQAAHDVEWMAEAAVRLESRATEAERWQVAVAEGLGYLNRAEGQSGYEVAEPAVIVAAFRTAERDRDAARKNFAWSESLRAEALLGFQREQIRAAAAERRAEAAEAALMAVSTDNAQDALEDPVGHAEREAAGFYRIGKGAIDAMRRALAAASPSRKGDATPADDAPHGPCGMCEACQSGSVFRDAKCVNGWPATPSNEETTR